MVHIRQVVAAYRVALVAPFRKQPYGLLVVARNTGAEVVFEAKLAAGQGEGQVTGLRVEGSGTPASPSVTVLVCS